MDSVEFLAHLEAIKNGDIAVQEEAANAIVALNDPQYLPQIQYHINDPDPLIRRVMLWTLRNYAGSFAYAPLLPYLSDPDMAVREAALVLFMEGGTDAAAALVDATLAADQATQFAAVQALGQFRTPEAIQPLMRAAESSNPDIREVAVLSLGVYPDPEVISALFRALQDEPQIRIAGLEGLKNRELSAEEKNTVAACLNDEHPEIRAAAVRVLGSATPASAALDAESFVRRAAAEFLTDANLLARLCADPDSSVRTAAAESIGRQNLGLEDILLPMLSDSVPGVRRAAVTALGNSDRPDVIPALVRCLQDPKLGIRAAAATVLGKIGGDEVIAALEEAAKSGNPILRGIIQNALNTARK